MQEEKQALGEIPLADNIGRFKARVISADFRSRRKLFPSLWNLRYGCFTTEDGSSYPILNNLNSDIKVMSDDLTADIIMWADGADRHKVAVNIVQEIGRDFTERGGSNPNPPHGGGDDRFLDYIRELDPATEILLRNINVFIPEVIITTEGEHQHKVFQLILPIVIRGGKPFYKKYFSGHGDDIEVDLFQFDGGIFAANPSPD